MFPCPHLTVSGHAVRRYRQRVGRKTADRVRLQRHIKKQILRAIEDKNYKKLNQHSLETTPKYRIDTPEFYAVCTRKVVITLYSKQHKQ